MMDAPTCRTCGQKHWSRVCDGDDSVTKRVTPRVTSSAPVTATVTPLREADLEVALKKALAEIERLTTEVASLKRQLAERPVQTKKPEPMSAVERMRRMRERHRKT